MSFTYDLESPTDVTRVRFKIRDTRQEEAMFQDAEINFAISEADGNWKQACIDLLVAKLGDLAATPDFNTADLKLDIDKMCGRLEKLLSQLRDEFGIHRGRLTSGVRERTDLLYYGGLYSDRTLLDEIFDRDYEYNNP